MNIAVTGGAGLIGSHLVDKLLKEGHRVVVIDDLSGGLPDNVNSEALLVKADCRDLPSMREVFRIFKPEIVYHLAANAAEGKSHFSPIDITSRNYDTFLSVLVAGLGNGMRRIIVTSSVAVYGSATPPFSEETKPEPEDLYGLSKLNIEESLKILSKVHNFEWVVARAHNVYGPRQSMRDPYRNVVMIWMNKILKGEPYVIYGDGSMQRCYTYISDLAEGLYQMGVRDVSGEVFNLGADEPVSLKQLSDAIQEVTSGVVPPQFLPARPQEVVAAVLVHKKAEKLLAYKTKTSLIDGISKTWEWAKQQGPQRLVYTDFEIESDKIPKNWRQ
jgi:UDP-glucose 4-epimerase